jgi:hypothetical protein
MVVKRATAARVTLHPAAKPLWKEATRIAKKKKKKKMLFVPLLSPISTPYHPRSTQCAMASSGIPCWCRASM